MIPQGLPSPLQTWSHSTVTSVALNSALSSPSITAIEADILMSPSSVPIMAHPPSRESDLTFEDFIERCLGPESNPGGKHVKLDFKELSVVQPCIETLTSKIRPHPKPPAIFYNADVLPGPGKRGEDPTVDGDAFVEACLSKEPVGCFSLGWSCHVARVYNEGGVYLKSDVDDMVELCKKHKLGERSGGLVFAANARIVFREPETMAELLEQMPVAQLLLWTGTGEPPIRQSVVDWLKVYYNDRGVGDRVGFDCNIAEGAVDGIWQEAKVKIINVINYFRGFGIAK